MFSNTCPPAASCTLKLELTTHEAALMKRQLQRPLTAAAFMSARPRLYYFAFFFFVVRMRAATLFPRCCPLPDTSSHSSTPCTHSLVYCTSHTQASTVHWFRFIWASVYDVWIHLNGSVVVFVPVSCAAVTLKMGWGCVYYVASLHTRDEKAFSHSIALAVLVKLSIKWHWSFQITVIV